MNTLLSLPAGSSELAKALVQQSGGTLVQNVDGKTWSFEGKSLPDALKSFVSDGKERTFVLDVPFAARAVAQASGAIWDARLKSHIYKGSVLPVELQPYGSADFSLARLSEEIENRESGKSFAGSGKIKPRPHQVEAIKAIVKSKQSGRCGFLLSDDVGLGKAQPLDSLVLTPSGFTTLGSIKIGDVLVSPMGGTTKVIGIFPQGMRDIYNISFTDGAEVECDYEHLWNVNTTAMYSRGNPCYTLPLSEIHACYTNKNGSVKYYIPMLEAPDLECKSERNIDPYLLGVLLGDGHLRKKAVFFSSADREIVELVSSLVPSGLEVRHQGKYDYRICKRVGGGLRTNTLLSFLRELGLEGTRSHNKFVPEAYIHAPAAVRIAVLQGLLDTDGHVRPKDNNVEFCTVSQTLAKNVQWLIQSLGGTARLRTKKSFYLYKGERKEGKLVYRMSVILPGGIQPFRLARKASVYRPRPGYAPSRGIKSITFAGRKFTQCIKVDSEDQLYVTNDFVVTHNTITTWASIKQMESVDSVLIVSPLAVVAHWRRTIRELGDGGKKVVVMNYERLGKLFEANEAVKVAKRKRTKNKRLAEKGELAFDFDVVVFDESHRCFPGDTLVTTSTGEESICSIVDKKKAAVVLTKNLYTGKLEWKQVSGWLKNWTNTPLVRIIHEYGEITATADHPVWTKELGYIPAQGVFEYMTDPELRSGWKIISEVPYEERDAHPCEMQAAGSGVYTSEGPLWVSGLLQEGSWVPPELLVSQECDRSGGEISPTLTLETLGPDGDWHTGLSRVVRVEILEQGRERGDGQGGIGYQEVYCLEVSGNQNFFANGVLVSNCKNPTAQRSVMAARLVGEADFALWLSATAGQHPLELSYLAPLLAQATGSKVKDLAEFEKWCVDQGIGISRGNFGKWEWAEDPEDCEKVRKMLFDGNIPAGIRRRPEDIAGWPEIARVIMPVELPSEERRLYEKVWTEFRRELQLVQKGQDPKAGIVAQLRFRQKSSILRIPGTVELTEELIENGRRVAISVQFIETMNELKERLEKKGYACALVYGKQSGNEKEMERMRFQTGKAQVVIFTIEEGISLHRTEDDEVDRAEIIHDARFSAISLAQIEGRCHRDGQRSTVYYVFAEDTVEEKIIRTVVKKMVSMKNMVGDDVTTLKEIEQILHAAAT